MNSRLQQFLSAENITQAEFADTIRVARASVSHILAGRNKPGYDFITGIMKNYPALNIEWLLTGKGKMYKNDSPVKTEEKIPSSPKERHEDAGEGIFETSDDLFSFNRNRPVREVPGTEFSGESTESGGDTRFSEGKKPENAQEIRFQTIEKQRKAVRIMIFYDDNTFDEFRK